MVILAGGEKVTGNMGLILPAVIFKKATLLGYLKNIALVYVGNFLGACFYGYVCVYQTEVFRKDPYLSHIQAYAAEKTSKKFHVMLIRGIAANWLINLATILATSSK